jgi:class 3 adenylate cyclase
MSNPPSVLSHRTSKSSLGTQGTKLLSTFLSDHVREYLDRRVLEQNQAILSKDPPQDTDELIWDIPTLDTCIIESFAVIVMADVSGYSRLTSVMSERGKTGFELLTKTMKDYLDNIVDIVMAHNGDIIKFAGDAVLFYWKLDAKERRNTCIASKTNSCNCPKCLKGEVVLRAALCCTDLLKRLGRYEINIEGCDVKHLSIHLGIGAGNLMDVHAKGNEYRFEHFVAGDAVNQLMAVLNDAKPGRHA